MNRLRILLITSGLGAGGAEQHVLALCRCLAAAGHEPSVCTLSRSEGGLEARFLAEGFPLYRVPLDSLRRLLAPRFTAGLRRMLADSRPDIIHAHLYHAEIAAGYASLFSGAALVTTRHSAGLEFQGSRAVMARIVSRAYAACIAVSEEAATEAVSNGYPRRLVTVLPNAVDPTRFRPLEPEERERRRRALGVELFPGAAASPFFLIGSAGGLKQVKNYSLFLRAFARLLRRMEKGAAVPGVRFVVFGEGAERESLRSLARDLGTESIVSLPGHRNDLEEILPLLDVFVLASSREGVPLALLEAMASGVACVASDVGGMPDVLAGVGLVIPPGDEEALAAAMQQLVEQKDMRAEFARTARVRILERYSTDIWCGRILALYAGVAPAERKNKKNETSGSPEDIIQ